VLAAGVTAVLVLRKRGRLPSVPRVVVDNLLVAIGLAVVVLVALVILWAVVDTFIWSDCLGDPQQASCN
jgi:hypothetical protein